ncbi:hypothetical protein P3S68_023743 [Capsicum galapagoense]
MNINQGKKLSSFHQEKENKEEFLNFLSNGSSLLEEQLSFSKNGQQKIPLRSFSAKEIINSTNGFQERVGPYLYKGNFNEKNILVKKYERKKKTKRQHDYVIRDIVISKLKIAIDIASVILYLHIEFPRPIIHRNLTSNNVILDKNGVVKLYNFECCIPLPIGKVKVQDDLMGTIGYLDPEYVRSNNVTLKSDVFSFGLFLLMLLCGKEIKVNYEGIYYCEDYGLISLENYAKMCIKNNKLEDNIIDSKILQEDQKKLKAFLNLALICAKNVGENRPNMIDVAKELQRIKKGELQSLLTTMECLIDWN